MYYDNDFAIIIPVANEEKEFAPLVKELVTVSSPVPAGLFHVYADSPPPL